MSNDLSGIQTSVSSDADRFFQVFEETGGVAAFMLRNKGAIFRERLRRGFGMAVDGENEGEIEIGVGEFWLELGGHLEMELRELKIVLIEVKVGQVVMRLCVTRIMLEAGGEAIERFQDVAALRMDNSEVTVCVRHAIVLLDRSAIEIGRAFVAAFVGKERLLEHADAGCGKLENLRFGRRKKIELIRIGRVAATLANAAIPRLGEVPRRDWKF